MADNLLTYGFLQWRHLAAEMVTSIGERAVYTAIQESAAEHTRMINALLAGMAQRTTDFKVRFYLSGDGTLQPITEDGSPQPVRPGGYFDVAFPIYGGGTAWGTNRISRAKLTVADADRLTFDAQKRDADWLKRHLLAALFTNTTRTFTDPKHGSLTIQPLAIASDGVKYNRVGGSQSTDEHYLAQAADIDDAANPFPTIYTELTEHPGNGSNVVVYVPSNLTDDIEGLTDFVAVADPFITPGNASDQLSISAAQMNAIRGPGDMVLGRTNKCWIVEWKALPDDYMIGQAIDAGPVLAMREHAEAPLQGFFTENDSGDGNLTKTNMLRFCGFGVQNRVAAVAYRVGNENYAIPTGYTAPLPV